MKECAGYLETRKIQDDACGIRTSMRQVIPHSACLVARLKHVITCTYHQVKEMYPGSASIFVACLGCLGFNSYDGHDVPALRLLSFHDVPIILISIL